MNRSGKALTVFLVVIAILMVAVSAIAVFFFFKEIELRESAEASLEEMQVIEVKLQNELKDARAQLKLYEEKNADADKRIEDLLSEIEFEQGLREELKKEIRGLRESLESEASTKQSLIAQLNEDKSAAEGRITDLQRQLDEATTKVKQAEQRQEELHKEFEDLMRKYEDLQVSHQSAVISEGEIVEPDENVDLETIVVTPFVDRKGKVVSVDQETNFLIVSLGETDGIKKNMVLSVFRGDQYLGDITVSRVLPEMSAADFIPPLTSQEVQKNDRVVVKE